ncbi:hypothetical protein MTO96_032703 [Rhipicephalus appendiculatus]
MPMGRQCLPAFYVRDIPSNDRRSEAERFVPGCVAESERVVKKDPCNKDKTVIQERPRAEGSLRLVYPLPSPQHPRSLRTLLQAPRECTSAAQTHRRKPPRFSQRTSNASPKSASTNDAARALSSSAKASASPAPNPFRSNPGYLRPSPLDHVRHFNASGSTSETSRNAHGAPVPPAFYVRDIPSNDRRSGSREPSTRSSTTVTEGDDHAADTQDDQQQRAEVVDATGSKEVDLPHAKNGAVLKEILTPGMGD